MRRALLALATAATLALLAGCGADPAPAGVTTLHVLPAAQRQPAPALAGETLDGARLDRAGRPGDVLVVNFWGSWCAPCVSEADDLEQTYVSTKDSRVSFVGVNVRDVREDAKGFVSAHGLSYPNLFDPASRLALGFAVPPSSIPSTILIDRQGRVALTVRRAVIRDELQRLVTELASEAS